MQPLSGNQRPDLLTSDEHVSCTAPATENASLQILFKCPTPAILFENATKPARFASFCSLLTRSATRNDIWTSKTAPYLALFALLTWKCASRHSCVHFFDISTSKSGPTPRCFLHFDLEMCFAPQQRPLFQHLNFQKWSEHGVFFTLGLGNVLRATMAYTFSTSKLPKVVWDRQFLTLLTSKCASHLARWLRAYFSTLQSHKSWEKHKWIAAFPPFRAPASSLFSLFLFSDLLSSSPPLWLFPPLLFSLNLISTLDRRGLDRKQISNQQ